MNQALGQLVQLPGVETIILVGADGLVVESATAHAKAIRPDRLGAEIAGLSWQVNIAGRALSGSKVFRYQISTEQHEILAVCIGRFTLGVALKRGSPLRAIQVDLARVAVELVQQLPEEAR